jgi:hypothetical protein
MKTVTAYQAFDGAQFSTEAECKAHEGGLSHMRLVGLTIEQVEAGIARTDVELADALETVGARVRRTRIAGGEFKRERKGKTQEPPLAPGSEA